ncbi:Na+/H+ antiporter subunit E [Devosia pacifica]|uniref:Na+/H+ antiporter subunit E n=1 Tax=Devosia pacifica TaxID=1335967 RepID=A0A918VWB6_9HYPH|nr:Na+/H+ antiporter subunit E [Devosia pacifica]GHA29547.1 Na+/H+ antiporter subunit E [Devosia pacifica]
MSLLLLTFLLSFIWALITGTFTLLNLLLGAVIGVAAMYLLRSSLPKPKAPSQIRRILSLLLLFLYELMLSAIRVARIVLDPQLKKNLRPAIVAVPLDVKRDAEIMLLANMITLTPGTLSLDVSEDKKTLFVHVLTLDSKEAVVADIKNGFEAKIREIYEDDLGN